MAGYKLLDNEFMSGFRELAFAGYGLFFVSHEKQITDDNDNTQVIPAIPSRPYQLINKLVDSIVYLRAVDETNANGEVESKRYLFFRGNNSFYAGSRFHYIVPKIELSYENLLKAISDAVDAEVAHKGGAATDEKNPYLTLDFDGIMEDAKAIWIKTDDEQKEKILKILEEEFGKPTKFSDISSEEVEKLNKALSRIREII